jgi:hypothetical protein
MPARNAAATVRSAARSILRQTVRDLAVVVVDDGDDFAARERLDGLGDGVGHQTLID